MRDERKNQTVYKCKVCRIESRADVLPFVWHDDEQVCELCHERITLKHCSPATETNSDLI